MNALAGGLAVWVAGFCLPLPAHSAPPAVPDALKVPANETLVLTSHAKGVQVYVCQPKKDDAAQYEWVLKAPEADLFDEGGQKIGRHYGGPTWESTDGSKVVGELKGRAPSPDANAIPWLLLGAKSHEGAGVFSHVDGIQRLETAGGKAPAGVVEASQAGQELRVPYTAVYYFFAPAP